MSVLEAAKCKLVQAMVARGTGSAGRGGRPDGDDKFLPHGVSSAAAAWTTQYAILPSASKDRMYTTHAPQEPRTLAGVGRKDGTIVLLAMRE